MKSMINPIKKIQKDVGLIHDEWLVLYNDFILISDINDGIAERKWRKNIFFETKVKLEYYFYRELCLTIRRTLDSTRKTRNLKRILRDLLKYKTDLTLDKSLKRLGLNYGWGRDNYLKVWETFSYTKHSQQISNKKINKIIQDLDKIYSPVKGFVDSNIAHSNSEGKVKSVTYSQLWNAISFIFDLIDDLNALLSSKGVVRESFHNWDRHEHLRTPWWPRKFVPKINKKHMFGRKIDQMDERTPEEIEKRN